MADSDEKKPEVAQPVAGPLVKQILNADGKTFRDQPVAANGRFMKKVKKLASTLDHTRSSREFMNQRLEVDANGKITKASRTRWQQHMDAMHFVIVDGAYSEDPKKRMASVTAAKFLREAAFGPARDVEQSAEMQTQIKAIYISIPQLPSQGELPPAETLKPHFENGEVPFIDAEVVEDREKK
jgi:hypothetical protein